MSQTQDSKVKYLPLINNPLLNCLFNNPHHTKYPFKRAIHELSANHNNYTILLPPAHILNTYYDPSSEGSSKRVLLKELCYNSEDFIQSHIVKSCQSQTSRTSKTRLVMYNSLNDKQILIKGNSVFTGRGFKKSLKLRIVAIDYFHSFCDYFPKGSRFMVLYIEDTLFGSLSPISLSSQKVITTEESSTSMSSSQQSPVNIETITLDKLLRSFPLLSRAVSGKFYRLFHHNNAQFAPLYTHTRKKLGYILLEFENIIEAAYLIVLNSVKLESPNGEDTYTLIHQIMALYPGLDFNRLVFEYVELNLYDRIWSQLVYQFDFPNDDKEQYEREAIKVLTPNLYKQLSCVSLNQLEITACSVWEINELMKRILAAIAEFSKLSDSTVVNLSSKTKVLIRTIELLSENTNPKEEESSFILDADTLLGLLIMVVLHSKIENLEAHLYYIKNFNSVDYSHDGYFNYILSNFEAVLLHFSPQGENAHTHELVQYSQENYEFWLSIQRGDLLSISNLLESVYNKHGDDLPEKHCLKSRNIQGESCLAFAIKARNFNLFELLMTFNVNWFSIDDILFDVNVKTNQTLLMLALEEECEDISEALVEVIVANTSIEERIGYFNYVDVSHRSVGHYLFHNYQLIDKIGYYIDWELKDMNSHTPLFSICRCYDHPEYVKLVKRTFECVVEVCKIKSKCFNFDDHLDKAGNSLLHIVPKNLKEMGFLNCGQVLDVNQFNSKNMTPLSHYVKYSRADNLEELLQDRRLIFKLNDPNNHYNVLDYFGVLSMKSNGSLSSSSSFDSIDKLLTNYIFDNFVPLSLPGIKLYALNAKYEATLKDWVLFFRDDNRLPFYRKLEDIKKFIYAFKLLHPLSIITDPEAFWLNYPPNLNTMPMFGKFRMNYLIEDINFYFRSIQFQSKKKQDDARFLLGDELNKLTLELRNYIMSLNESQRNQYGELVLSRTDIQDVEFFLNYSMNDILKYQKLVSKFNKIAAMTALKHSDHIQIVDDVLVEGSLRGFILTTMTTQSGDTDQNHHINESHAMLEFLACTTQLENACSRLRKNVDIVLGRIQTWKEHYKEIKTIEAELQMIDTINLKMRLNSPNNPNGRGTPLSRRSTFSSEEVADFEDDEEEQSASSIFNFGAILESKKSKYKKLTKQKADLIKQVIKMNSEIKCDHDLIASEISDFLKYKSTFIEFAIKKYVVSILGYVQHRKCILQKRLLSLKQLR